MRTPFKIVFSADDALSLVELRPDERDALAARLRASLHWCETVPGMDSVTVQFDPMVESPQDAFQRLEQMLEGPIQTTEISRDIVEIPVCYQSPHALDLGNLAARLGISVEEIISRHVSIHHRVEMLGFTPGFAYLSSTGHEIQAARRSRPRQSVPAGSVGVANGFTGLYALTGPGGWPIIGRTPMRLFDPSMENPVPYQPGTHIRFVAIDIQTFERLSV